MTMTEHDTTDERKCDRCDERKLTTRYPAGDFCLVLCDGCAAAIGADDHHATTGEGTTA
jgi:hypothetical protein